MSLQSTWVMNKPCLFLPVALESLQVFKSIKSLCGYPSSTPHWFWSALWFSEPLEVSAYTGKSTQNFKWSLGRAVRCTGGDQELNPWKMSFYGTDFSPTKSDFHAHVDSFVFRTQKLSRATGISLQLLSSSLSVNPELWVIWVMSDTICLWNRQSACRALVCLHKCYKQNSGNSSAKSKQILLMVVGCIFLLLTTVVSFFYQLWLWGLSVFLQQLLEMCNGMNDLSP